MDKKTILPLQMGEFIEIEEGNAHLVSFVEEYIDDDGHCGAFRLVEPVGILMPLNDLRAKALGQCGFGQIEAASKQYISMEGMNQATFDGILSTGWKAIAMSGFFTDDLPDGKYFVKFAYPVIPLPAIGEIDDAWAEFKKATHNSKPSAEAASEWIDDYVRAHPEFDAPWIKDEMFTQISMTEEPCVDPDHYNDGLIDVRVIQDFCLIVFTSCSGKTKAVSFDSNLYTPMDLVEAYSQLFEDAWNEDKEKCLNNFKTYLYACGCTQEDLEGCGNE